MERAQGEAADAAAADSHIYTLSHISTLLHTWSHMDLVLTKMMVLPPRLYKLMASIIAFIFWAPST